MRIRAEQMKAFEQAAVRNFEDRMVAHLKNFAPNHSKILTEDEMRLVIRHGMKQAESHRFTSERSLRIYTELMLILGSSFDVDPQLPWAAELLNDEAVTEEYERIERLQDKAWDYVEKIRPDFGNAEDETGPKSFFDQIRLLRQVPDEELLSASLPDFYTRATAHLKETLPRKCEIVGEPALRQLINRAIEVAAGYKITTARGCAFLLAAMFMLGSGFDKDPQVPWAGKILRDESIIDQRERVDKLFAAAIECLKKLRRR